jgi:hypothetical protein
MFANAIFRLWRCPEGLPGAIPILKCRQKQSDQKPSFFKLLAVLHKH